MEALKCDPPKLPDMVMCGDHPSVTKTELSAKEALAEKETEKPKDINSPSYGKISPTSSHTHAEGSPFVLAPEESRARAASEHVLRLQEARRRLLERERTDVALTRPVSQAFPWAAMGSFRWPPYLLAVWVLVLVLTHALHCLVGALERALPAIRKGINYFRGWTEESWRAQSDMNQKPLPLGLAALTGALYAAYFALYALYVVALWAVEPLCAEPDDSLDKLTDAVTTSKTNVNIKQ